MKREEEYLVRNALLNELKLRRINRRQFMTRMIAAGLGLSGVNAALAGCVPVAPPPAAPAEQAPEAAEAPAVEEAGRLLTHGFGFGYHRIGTEIQFRFDQRLNTDDNRCFTVFKHRKPYFDKQIRCENNVIAGDPQRLDAILFNQLPQGF